MLRNNFIGEGHCIISYTVNLMCVKSNVAKYKVHYTIKFKLFLAGNKINVFQVNVSCMIL